jgi:hypothetical protein
MFAPTFLDFDFSFSHSAIEPSPFPLVFGFSEQKGFGGRSP